MAAIVVPRACLLLNAALFVIAATPLQTGAKALFNSSSTMNVGVHYWFEDSRGVKFADPAAAGAGSNVTLHVRSSVSASLTVWMSDATHPSVELTSPGQRVAAGEEFVVSGLVVGAPGKSPQRIAIFLARAQMEQVTSFSGALDKLARIVARTAADGSSVIVREVDRDTPQQIGTYIVNRAGGQAGAEIVMQAPVPGPSA